MPSKIRSSLRRAAFDIAALSLALLLSAGQIAAYDYAQLRQLIENGQYDMARSLVSAAQDEFTPVAVKFTEAMILKREGALERSTGLMEEIINSHPQFDRVRQELAHSYYLMGKPDRAKYQFELLSASSPSPAFRNIYDRYITDINRQRPWQFSAYLAAAPSSNITSGTASEIIVIGGVPMRADNPKKSGTGLRFGTSGSYQFQFNEALKLTLGGSVDGVKFRGSDYDELHLRSFAELAYRIGNWQYSVAPLVERSLLNWDGYRAAYGVQTAIQKFIPEWGGTLRLGARWRDLDYDDIVALNGHETALSAHYRQAFQNTYLASVGITYIDLNTQRDFSSYHAWRPSFELSAELPSGMIGSIGATFEQRDYDGKFPWVGENRDDKILNLTVGATFKTWEYKGFAPRIEYSYQRSKSNIALYDYDNHSINLYLTKDF